jgi:ankyrin repeat protein
MRGDGERVDREIVRDASLARAVIGRHPRALIDAAERANTGAVELLAHIGYDVNLRDGQTALHLAAYTGSRPMCELLLRLGADPAIRDTAYDGTAADWARHAHHDELVGLLVEDRSRLS